MTGPGRSAIARILTLNCDESSMLASRERDEPLSFVDRLAHYGHLLACSSCRRFRRQLNRIGKFLNQDEGASSGGLSAEARDRIARAIASAEGRDDRDR